MKILRRGLKRLWYSYYSYIKSSVEYSEYQLYKLDAQKHIRLLVDCTSKFEMQIKTAKLHYHSQSIIIKTSFQRVMG